MRAFPRTYSRNRPLSCKNLYMKHSVLVRLVAAITLGSFGAACSDEVPPIPSSELYTREFVKRFGLVDKAHTWNVSRRANVKVTTDRASRIKVSGVINGKRYLLADYAEVNGSRTLVFDMPLGFDDIRVTDGYEDIDAKVGASVNFARGSRIVYEYPDHDVVKVTRTEYRDITDQGVRSFNDTLPEEVDNVDKVIENFTFIANGPFTIYPVFWNTNAYNTLGIYYEIDELDEDGNKKLVHVPFYTNKIKRDSETDSNLQYMMPGPQWPALDAEWVAPQDKYIVKDWDLKQNYGFDNLASEFTDEDIAQFKTLFLEKYPAGPSYGVNNGVMTGQQFDNAWYSAPEEYTSQRKLDDIQVEITGNDIEILSFHFTAVTEIIGEMPWNNALDECSYKNKAFFESYTKFAAENPGLPDAELKALFEKETGQKMPMKWRSRGIHIDIKPGTKFGMYIRHEQNAPDYDEIDVVVGKDDKERFYSNAERNPDMMYDREGNLIPAVHAATYMYTNIHGTQYRILAFEDWLNTPSGGSNNRVADLNDMVFFIASDDPTEIPSVKDEDEGQPIEWLVACEDLGNLDDFDFNDVVFSVSHVAGKEEATVTPLAAGGTLETYLHYIDETGADRVLGDIEWHEHFGVYDYTQMINTRSLTHRAKPVTIKVPADFTLSPLLHGGDINTPTDLTSAQLVSNMGGFHVNVVREDGAREDITAPSRAGEAPQMFLIPQVKPEEDFTSKWLWPVERHAIEKAYPKFTEWIKNFHGTTDWHYNGAPAHVVNR